MVDRHHVMVTLDGNLGAMKQPPRDRLDKRHAPPESHNDYFLSWTLTRLLEVRSNAFNIGRRRGDPLSVLPEYLAQFNGTSIDKTMG